MLDGHPFNFPLFELYCAPIYAPIAHHFFMNVRKHLSSFRSLQAQKMRYSFIFNDLCQTVKNSVRCVTNHNAQFHICLQLLYLLTFSSVLYAIPHQFGTNSSSFLIPIGKEPDTVTDYNTTLPFSQGAPRFSLQILPQIAFFPRIYCSNSLCSKYYMLYICKMINWHFP